MPPALMTLKGPLTNSSDVVGIGDFNPPRWWLRYWHDNFLPF